MTDILYDWPSGAKFGSRVPKERFYERTANNSVLRGKFVSEVQRIIWMYKLAEETINLPSTDDVPEIEVLWLHAKARDIDDSVLAAIDKAIPNPIIFEVHRDETDGSAIRMAAAYKPVGSGSPKPSAYFSTGWMPGDVPRASMPTAITLAALYSRLLTQLTPISAQPGESVSEVADRLKVVCKLEREIGSLERKLRTELQLNRKVELRRELKDRQAALAALVMTGRDDEARPDRAAVSRRDS